MSHNSYQETSRGQEYFPTGTEKLHSTNQIINEYTNSEFPQSTTLQNYTKSDEASAKMEELS
jgi:hypothetical protein